MKVRLLYNDSSLNCDSEVKATSIAPNSRTRLIAVEAYKADDIRLGYAGGIPEIYWEEYGEHVSPAPAITQLQLPELDGWEVFSAMAFRDSINICLISP